MIFEVMMGLLYTLIGIVLGLLISLFSLMKLNILKITNPNSEEFICFFGLIYFEKKNKNYSINAVLLSVMFSLILWLLSYFIFNYNLLNNNDFSYVFNYESLFVPILCSLLIGITLTDLKDYLVPLEFSIPIFLLCTSKYIYTSIIEKDYQLLNVLGFVIPFILLATLILIEEKIFKKDALGYGDVILLCSIGLYSGIFNFIFLLLLSSISALIVECFKFLLKKNKTFIPFAPYISFASIIVLYFGNSIINSYMGLFDR